MCVYKLFQTFVGNFKADMNIIYYKKYVFLKTWVLFFFDESSHEKPVFFELTQPNRKFSIKRHREVVEVPRVGWHKVGEQTRCIKCMGNEAEGLSELL